jgi:hypothetical protein
MNLRIRRPATRVGAALTMLAASVGLTATMAVASPAAQAAPASATAGASSSSCIVYAGYWKATDPSGYLTNLYVNVPHCTYLTGTAVYAWSHPWLGLGNPTSVGYWGRANSVTFGYLGTTVTARWDQGGLHTYLTLHPAGSYLRVTGYETYSNGGGRTLTTQYFQHA